MTDRFVQSLWTTQGQEADLIPLLQAAQDSYGYVPESAMEAISEVSGIPTSKIYGVVTFYNGFRLTPRGHFMARICTGTACHVNGAPALESTVEDLLGIKRGETDTDLIFTLEAVNCVGCCSLAPVVMINDDTHGSLTPRTLTRLFKKLQRQGKAKMLKKGER